MTVHDTFYKRKRLTGQRHSCHKIPLWRVFVLHDRARANTSVSGNGERTKPVNQSRGRAVGLSL
ncbi:hypothetical protein ACX52_4359 [Yersinia pestis]|nr:hypothetical protein ACX52_4359 [Yersinia pestis]